MDRELIKELKKLNKNIEKMDGNTTKWSKSLAYLTFLLVIVGMTQIFLMFKEVIEDSHLFLLAIIFYCAYIIFYSILIFRDLKKL